MSISSPNPTTASFPLFAAQAVMQAVALGSPGPVIISSGTPYTVNLSSIGSGGLQKLFIYFSSTDSNNNPVTSGSLTINRTSNLGTSVEELTPGGIFLIFDPSPVNGTTSISISTTLTQSLVYIYCIG